MKRGDAWYLNPYSATDRTDTFGGTTVGVLLLHFSMLLHSPFRSSASWYAALAYVLCASGVPNTTVHDGLARYGAFVSVPSLLSLSLSFPSLSGLSYVHLQAKVGQAWFMHEDEKMCTNGDVSESGMIVKNVDLNDELGRVQYIFSDKTGTLTQNQMVSRDWPLANEKIIGVTHSGFLLYPLRFCRNVPSQESSVLLLR